MGMARDFANLDEYAKTRAPTYGNVRYLPCLGAIDRLSSADYH